MGEQMDGVKVSAWKVKCPRGECGHSTLHEIQKVARWLMELHVRIVHDTPYRSVG